MSLAHNAKSLLRLIGSLGRHPGVSLRVLRTLSCEVRGALYGRDFPGEAPAGDAAEDGAGAEGNPLRSFFESRKEGPGIWRWRHYFDIYHRHFRKFVGREVHLVEIGVYSGGSLDMWRPYFGPGCRIYGVDIQPACRSYEQYGVKIFIGDQADRGFWRDFRAQVPRVDILIDDGGHKPDQQIVTLEETLPRLSPGGVYVCEDVHETHNEFAAYVRGLADALNACRLSPPDPAGPGHPVCAPTGLQSMIQSVHLYPFVTVIEKADRPVREFCAPKHGTQWQPFKPTP